jgi:L-lactate dehydrogenase complex protein LldG
MDAREEILATIRRNTGPARPLPSLDGVGATFPDLAARFAESVTAVGGTAVRVADRAAADEALRALPVHRAAKRMVSLAPGVGRSTFDPAQVKDPHELEGLDLVVLEGAFGVAENGAVWIEGASLPHHALVVIAEHVAVVVEAATLVPDLGAAYARLDLASRPRWGLFLAGPSKTADIEQALVIGAHGARSATVFVVG